MVYHMAVGPATSIFPFIGLKPALLLTAENEYRRLGPAAYNQKNLAWAAGLGFSILRKLTLSVDYSNDLFENLKDRNIYDAYGRSIGTQKSKTKLLSLSLYYHF